MTTVKISILGFEFDRSRRRLLAGSLENVCPRGMHAFGTFGYRICFICCSLFTDFLFLLELVEIEIKILTRGDMMVWLARDNFSFACLLVTLALHARYVFEEKIGRKKYGQATKKYGQAT